MPFTTIRTEIASRFNESQALITSIRSQEPPAGSPISAELYTLRGLAIVHIYSVFEYSVTRIITQVNESISNRNVLKKHFNPNHFPLALDPQLTSIRDSSFTNKWKTRKQLFISQVDTDFITINVGILTGDLENIWFKTLKELFAVYDLTSDPVYNLAIIPRIDSLVERRNAVSHGRESAADVGRNYASSDLQAIYDIINSEVTFLLDTFQNFLNNKNYILPVFHPIYP